MVTQQVCAGTFQHFFPLGTLDGFCRLLCYGMGYLSMYKMHKDMYLNESLYNSHLSVTTF